MAPDFEPLGAHPMADRLLRVLRHEALQFGFGPFVFKKGRVGPSERSGKFRPSVGTTHIDNTDGFYAWLRRVDAEQAWRLTIFHAAPKLALGRNYQVLVQRIGMGLDLHPLPAPGYDRQNRAAGRDDPHVMLKLRSVFCDRGLPLKMTRAA